MSGSVFWPRTTAAMADRTGAASSSALRKSSRCHVVQVEGTGDVCWPGAGGGAASQRLATVLQASVVLGAAGDEVGEGVVLDSREGEPLVHGVDQARVRVLIDGHRVEARQADRHLEGIDAFLDADGDAGPQFVARERDGVGEPVRVGRQAVIEGHMCRAGLDRGNLDLGPDRVREGQALGGCWHPPVAVPYPPRTHTVPRRALDSGTSMKCRIQLTVSLTFFAVSSNSKVIGSVAVSPLQMPDS
ncbi:hypothetical protein AB0G85_36430 [Streptomyces sioyaensis]|uniref:hypothetical protein n=1 Tax=Streptomyces sioyaensis TaxID=67364 RepID=UPI003403F880